MKITRNIIGLLLVVSLVLGLSSCGTKVQATDLMKGIKESNVTVVIPDGEFEEAYLDFALKTFKSTAKEKRDENHLISPLSVMYAVAMTANGAEGETKREMERLLGGELSIDEINEYLGGLSLPSDDEYKLSLANSIWFYEDEGRLQVKPEFLQKNLDYYSASAYKAPFDSRTVKDINNWVNDKTDGMIDKIVDDINPRSVMYLINALSFDAQWDDRYMNYNVADEIFTNLKGERKTVSMMSSAEELYLDDGKATGFVKYYEDKAYSFVALLPNEDVNIYDYIDSLNTKTLSETISNAQDVTVYAKLPKFSYDYSLEMNGTLCGLGMPTAFDASKADFSGIGHSSMGNLYIGTVLHKTHIDVDELGTRAAAVTKVNMEDGCAMEPQDVRNVTLDRPFVYMIMSEYADLPIFMGVVTDIGD